MRTNGAGLDVVLDAFRQRRQQKFVSVTGGLRLHIDGFPLRGAVIAGHQLHPAITEAAQVGSDELVRLPADGLIAWVDEDLVERTVAIARRAGPQQGSPVAEEARSGQDEPQEDADTGDCGDTKRGDATGRNDERRLVAAGDFERVLGQQLHEWVARRVGRPLGEGQQPLLEFRDGPLDAAGRAAPVQPAERQHDAGGQSGRQRDEQEQARAREAQIGEREAVDHQHQEDG